MIKTSFSYFIHCSNLQKLNILYIYTTPKKVLIIFASLEKKPHQYFNTEFSNTNMKKILNTLNSLNVFMAFEKPEPSNFMGRCKTYHLKGSIKS